MAVEGKQNCSVGFSAGGKQCNNDGGSAGGVGVGCTRFSKIVVASIVILLTFLLHAKE